MISVHKYERLLNIEFQRTKYMKGQNRYCVSSSRDDNILYSNNDPVSLVKDFGKKISTTARDESEDN